MISIISFTASWCPVCPRMKPVLFKLAESFNLDIFDADERSDKITEYKVSSLPTTIILKDGFEVERIVGAKPYSFILDKIKKVKDDQESD